MKFTIALMAIMALLAACQVTRMAEIYAYSRTHPMARISMASLDEAVYQYNLGDGADTAVLFMTGSGCASLTSHMPAYFRGLDGNYTIFGVEKPGISEGDTGLSCTDTYWQSANYDDRLAQNLVLARHLIEAKEQGKFSKLVLLGVSEGGTLAAGVQGLLGNKTDALVMIGAGGLSQRQSLKILHEKYGDFDPAIIDQAIAQNPNSLDLVYGQSVQYWQSFLDIAPRDLLADQSLAMLAIMGVKDRSEPIESLRAFGDNVDKWEMGGADHALIADGRDLKPDIMRRIADWLKEGGNHDR